MLTDDVQDLLTRLPSGRVNGIPMSRMQQLLITGFTIAEPWELISICQALKLYYFQFEQKYQIRLYNLYE